MARFRDIPEFVRDSNYACDVSWPSLEKTIQGFVEDYRLDLEPDFQRGHVWTAAQQSAYLEYIMQGGPSGKDIYFNSPGFPGDNDGQMVLVDGLQRISAVRAFLSDEVPLFGHLFCEYTDSLRITQGTFKIHVNTLETRAEVLRWYLLFNAGGTPHSKKEIERVRELLDQELAK